MYVLKTLERRTLWGRGWEFCVQPTSPGRGGAQIRTAVSGGEEDVQQVAFITLVIITLLPSTAKMRPLESFLNSLDK